MGGGVSTAEGRMSPREKPRDSVLKEKPAPLPPRPPAGIVLQVDYRITTNDSCSMIERS